MSSRKVIAPQHVVHCVISGMLPKEVVNCRSMCKCGGQDTEPSRKCVGKNFTKKKFLATGVPRAQGHSNKRRVSVTLMRPGVLICVGFIFKGCMRVHHALRQRQLRT